MTLTKDQLAEARRDVAGFQGRFFYDAERGDIGYVAKKCDERQCDCEQKLNSDGDQDCSVEIASACDDETAEPMVRMLNAFPALLAHIDELANERIADAVVAAFPRIQELTTDRDRLAGEASEHEEAARLLAEKYIEADHRLTIVTADRASLAAQLAAVTRERDALRASLMAGGGK